MKLFFNKFSILLFYTVIVTYFAYFTPIIPSEATTFYNEKSTLSYLMHAGYSYFPNELGIRLFSIFSGLLGIVLFYIYSKDIFHNKKDALLATFIFSMLPIVVFGGTIANTTMFVFDLVLFYIISYFRKWYFGEIVAMVAILLIHDGAIVFFLALLFYSLAKREKRVIIESSLALCWILYHGIKIRIFSHPVGHFVDIFSTYAFAFSPFIFLYLLYAFYRIWVKEKKDIVWSISSFAIFVSILLSIRQRVYIADYIPYILAGFVLMFQTYFQSIRVRLPAHQRIYKNGFYASVAMEVLLLIMLAALPLIFALSGKYYVSKIYKPYKIAQELKEKGIQCYNSKNQKEKLQLRFYNISSCKK